MSEIRQPLPSGLRGVDVYMNLVMSLPDGRPFYINGLRLVVDRYMYERVTELADLDKWLHSQVLDYIRNNSSVVYTVVAMGGGL